MSVVDTDNLEMLKEVIGDDLKEILQSFIDIAPDTLSQIQTAMASGDANNLRLHAHTLKGSAANIGATNLPGLSLLLENKGKEGITDGLQSEFDAVKLETQAVVTFLGDYINSF